jgi:tripartite-type tricarboxylate transporter receptor subunit TctC
VLRRRHAATALAGSLLALALPAAAAAPATAQPAWPERTITLVVSFPPGGSTDVAARLLAPPLSEALGRPVVVENRPGAGGNIGIGAAARAAGRAHAAAVVLGLRGEPEPLRARAPYDPVRDFAPITTLGASPNVFAVRAGSPFRSLEEALAAARASPDRFNYASSGVGTTPHLAGELLKLRAGVPMQHIVFAGAGPATQGALAGTVDMLVAHQGSIEPLLRPGQLRPLAHTGAARAADMPDVPTLSELGFPGIESDTFLALWAPAATPAPVLARLAEAVLGILRRPDMAERFRSAGIPVVADGPEGLRARVAREVPLWRDVIRQARIAAE